jgi:hypothetical protein
MVVLTYSHDNNLTIIENKVFNALLNFFTLNDKVYPKMISGDFKNIGTILFEVEEIPYEIDIGFQITLRCFDHIFDYGEFVEFLQVE